MNMSQSNLRCQRNRASWSFSINMWSGTLFCILLRFTGCGCRWRQLNGRQTFSVSAASLRSMFVDSISIKISFQLRSSTRQAVSGFPLECTVYGHIAHTRQRGSFAWFWWFWTRWRFKEQFSTGQETIERTTNTLIPMRIRITSDEVFSSLILVGWCIEDFLMWKQLAWDWTSQT